MTALGMLRSAVVVVVLMLALFGCAPGGGLTPAGRTAVAVAIDLVECAPAEYSAVTEAVRSGGAAWIGVVLELIHCAPAVVRDLRLAGQTAAAGPADGVTVEPLSRGARRRLRVAAALAAVIGAR